MGAIGENGVRVLDEQTMRRSGVSDADLEAVESRERAELDRRVALLRRAASAPSLVDRSIIVVDDGMATGSTVLAACQVVAAAGAATVCVAVPVASRRAVKLVSAVADEVVCLRDPRGFEAVGQWYADFRQVTDEEVVALLRGVDG